MKAIHTRHIWWIFLLGSLFGVVGETLLAVRQQCGQVETALYEDFRILAFLNSDLGQSKAQILEEKVLAIPGTAAVRYLSRDEALSFLKERDPVMVQSVSVLGENPLNSVLEIRLESDAIAQVPQWIETASKLTELSDLRYKPLQAQAILRMRFYRHFLDLAMSLAAVPWFLGAGIGLWFALKDIASSHAARILISRLGVAAAGTFAGMCVAYAAAAPMISGPPWILDQGILMLAGLAGGLWFE